MALGIGGGGILLLEDYYDLASWAAAQPGMPARTQWAVDSPENDDAGQGMI